MMAGLFTKAKGVRCRSTQSRVFAFEVMRNLNPVFFQPPNGYFTEKARIYGFLIAMAPLILLLTNQKAKVCYERYEMD